MISLRIEAQVEAFHLCYAQDFDDAVIARALQIDQAEDPALLGHGPSFLLAVPFDPATRRRAIQKIRDSPRDPADERSMG